MPTKPQRRARGKSNPKPTKAVKKSLSFTPAAWSALEKHASRYAKANRTAINYSLTASALVLAGIKATPSDLRK